MTLRLKDFGPENPEVIKLKAQKEEIKQKIEKRLDGVLAGLEAKVASVGEGLTNLQREVATANQNDSEKAKAYRPYFEKKRELDELQRFRQVLTLKTVSESIDQNLPKTSMVTIMDEAKPEATSQSLWDKIRGKVESKARIKVDRDIPDVSSFTERSSGAGYDPYFIQTEFEVIQSERVLGKVVKDRVSK